MHGGGGHAACDRDRPQRCGCHFPCLNAAESPARNPRKRRSQGSRAGRVSKPRFGGLGIKSHTRRNRSTCGHTMDGEVGARARCLNEAVAKAAKFIMVLFGLNATHSRKKRSEPGSAARGWAREGTRRASRSRGALLGWRMTRRGSRGGFWLPPLAV